jgi:hypothetical protein
LKTQIQECDFADSHMNLHMAANRHEISDANPSTKPFLYTVEEAIAVCTNKSYISQQSKQ